jgi:hypothetical protein
MKIKRSQKSYSIEMKKESHLFCCIEFWDRQVICSERKLRLQKTKQINASERNSGVDHNPKNPLIQGAMLARFLPAPCYQAQRPVLRAHATWPLKNGPKKSEGFLNFFFLISVQTKLALQSSEFLFTKDK